MSQNKQSKQRGSVNYAWVLAGGYLIFTAIKIFKIILAGASDAPVFGTIGGIVFILVGAFLLRREWKAYRYGQEHIDDPTTWNLDDDDEELLDENGEAEPEEEV